MNWPFINVKAIKIHQKKVILTLRRWFYHYKTYENILKFNSWYPPLRHIHCLGKYSEAMIYECKNNKGVVVYRYTKSNLWINTSKSKFIRCKTMKTYLNSLHTSSNALKMLYMKLMMKSFKNGGIVFQYVLVFSILLIVLSKTA